MIKKIVFFLVIRSLFLPTFSIASNANVDNIKVAYIYNFIRYINWPEFNEQSEIFQVRTHEGSELKDKLKSLEQKSVKGKPIEILLISSALDDLNGCKVLVLPKLEPSELKKFTDYASPSNILTVSDTVGYAKLDVMINLIGLNNKIRFEVNLNVVDSTNLTISSSLLKLAKIIDSEN